MALPPMSSKDAGPLLGSSGWPNFDGATKRGHADAELVDQVRGERRSERDRAQRPRRSEVLPVRRAREPRVLAVQVVGLAIGPQDRVRPAQAMPRGEVVVELHRRLPLEELAGALPDVVVDERIEVRTRTPSVLVALLIFVRMLSDRRIDGRNLAVLTRQVQDVHAPDFAVDFPDVPPLAAPRRDATVRVRVKLFGNRSSS